MEFIDYLLVFWSGLGAVVYVVGSIYEQQQLELINKKKRHQYSDNKNLNDWQNSSYSTQRAGAYQYQENIGSAKAGSNFGAAQNSNTDNYLQSSQFSNKYPYSQSNINDQSPPVASPYDQQATSWNQSSRSTDPNASQYNATSFSSHPHEPQTKTNLDSPSYRIDPIAGHQHHHHQSTTIDGSGSNYRRSLVDSSSIPTATGFNSDCVDWINSVLYLFYTQTQKYGPIISESIYRSLNEKLSNITHSSSEYSHLVIEFTGINQESSSRPELTNMRTEIESDRSISTCCKIYNRRVSLDLTIQQLYGGLGSSSSAAGELQADFFGHSGSTQYELILENLEGKLKSMAMMNEKLLVIQFIDKPDTKIILRPLLEGLNSQRPTTNLINEDALVQIILQALTQVVVDLYFGDDLDFPQFCGQLSKTGTIKNKLSNILRIGSGAGDLKRTIKQEIFGSSGESNRSVFIKILKAKNINYNQSVTCLLELDDPQQQVIGSTRPGNSNPTWDEQFLFYLNDKSRELTVELWDSINAQDTSSKSSNHGSLKRGNIQNKPHASQVRNKSELTMGAKFLGLTRLTVAIGEVKRNPVQKLTLPLQPIASDLNNSVGGELSIELLYLENLVPSPSPSPTPSTTGGTIGSGLKKSTSASSLGIVSSTYSPGDVVSVDRKLTPSGYVITTTTITKQQPSKKRSQSPTTFGEHNQPGANFDESNLMTSSLETANQARADTPAGASNTTGGGGAGDARSEGAAESVAAPSSGGGRLSRSRSRSLLRAIKKRFSFSRTRSRSLGPGGVADGDASDYQADTDSATGVRPGSTTPASGRLDATGPDFYNTRSRASSEISAPYSQQDSRARSVPTSRDPNEVPTIVINKGRLSDTASAFTFTHPKSQLVIEVLEPTLERNNGGGGKQKGILRYYAIPDNASYKRKWSKRGVKLHLFNEHQFIACHLAGSSTCHLCGRVFSRRPGKQGYKCRNCHLLSHKQCHVKVDHNCPYATAKGLQLEYIDADPPANLAEELSGSAASFGHQTSSNLENQYEAGSPSTSGLRNKRPFGQAKMAKSISVEVDDR